MGITTKKQKKVSAKTKIIVDAVSPCGTDILYTKEMQKIPSFQKIYQQYLETKDKSLYFKRLKDQVHKMLQGKNMEQSLNVLKALGIEQRQNLRIALYSKNKKRYKFNVISDVILPFTVVAMVGGVVIRKTCPCIKSCDLLFHAFIIGSFASISAILAQHVKSM